MASTAPDLFNSALTIIGELAAGELPNADESIDGLNRLNALLSQWETIGLHVYVVVNFSHALAAATAAYTMGSGGTFNTARPVKIESAGVIIGSARIPLRIIGSKEWAEIADKAATAIVPEVLYNDDDYPLAKLNFWPAPTGTPTFDMYMWGEFTSFTVRKYSDLVIGGGGTTVTSAANPFTSADVNNYLNVTDGTGFTPGRYQITGVAAGVATLSASVGTATSTGGVATYDQSADYPPGYLKALTYNLAVDLAGEYGRPVDAIAPIAASSLDSLRALNASNFAATEAPPTQQVSQ